MRINKITGGFRNKAIITSTPNGGNAFYDLYNMNKKLTIENFDKEISNFIQVCPKEMIDKLKNPISLKSIIKEVS